MEKLDMLYEGKAKKIYRTNEEGKYIVFYKDSATAFNGEKKGTIANKGKINNRISSVLFQMLKNQGIENHFIKQVNDQEMLVEAVDIVALEVIVRNIAAGSMAKRLGIKEGRLLKRPVVEFCYKKDNLGDPMVNEDHIEALEIATGEEIGELKEKALKTNEILKEYFLSKGLQLVDFKLEFGRWRGKLLLSDEISPDTCRLWDVKTGEKLDKDRFRWGLGQIEEAYEEVLRRILG